MRRRSKKIGNILQECPGIGKTIEKFVEGCGVGADAWRRTGILTFDGNQRFYDVAESSEGCAKQLSQRSKESCCYA
jgi:hypothetical protein